MLQKYDKKPVDYETLKAAYFADEHRFKPGSSTGFHSNLPGVHNISDVFYRISHDDFLKEL